jgi:hypothetical protein
MVSVTTQQSNERQYLLRWRSFLADMWKGKFEETSFIFPNAPEIPISVVCADRGYFYMISY